MKYFKTIVLAIFMLISSQAWSATYYVSLTGDNSDGSTWAKAYITIQAGINAAGSGDTVLVADGTYTGAGNVSLTFGAAPNDFTLRSQTPLAAVIDGEGETVYGIYLHDSETNDATVEGFVITRCVSSYGAGVVIVNSSPSIKKIWFKNNHTTAYGGSLYIDGVTSNPLVEMCLFTGNSSDTTAGGIRLYLGATATFRNVTLSQNSATQNYPGTYLSSACTITNLISYGNIMVGMEEADTENNMTGATPTYSIYDYAETVSDTPGAGCLDSASNNPGFDPLFTPTNILVKEGGVDAWAGVDQTDIYGVTIDVSESIPMGASNQVPIVGGSLGLGLDLGL